MTEQDAPVAGWYPDPGMAGTQRYWDGDRWTDHRAPLTAAPTQMPKGVSGFTIAWGVALGIVLVIVGVWFTVSVVTADDDVECAIDNAQRAQEGRPTYDCR